MRSQQTGSMSGSVGGSGLGDFGLLTGGTGQTSQTGFGGGGGSGILQPTKPQSGLSMMGINDNTSSVSTSGSLFSGMQTGGTGGFNPQTQGNRSTLNPSYPGGSGTMSGAGNTSGLFSGMQMNNTQQQQQRFSNQSMQQGGMGGSGAGGGGGLLQPMVPTQQQQQPQPSSGQPIGNASTGWSSNINTQSSGPSQTLYGGGVQQSQSQSARGWSSNIAGNSNMSSGSAGIAGSGQNMGGMRMQPMQIGMGPTQMQGGMGMGQGGMGGGATWSTNNISGGGAANTGVAFQGGSNLPPTAASLMMGGGTGQPLMPQAQQPQHQQTAAANKPALGANSFADLSFLA